MATLAAPSSLPADVDLPVGEQDRLLDLARDAVAAAVGREPERALGPSLGPLRRGAAFVTLLEHGELRGCIGTLDASRPLDDSVAGAAAAAALHDVRFRPLTADELPAIEIEVSVLGPLVILADPMGFRLGVDGLLVDRGYQRGLLLPEVATMAGFDAEAMLDATCRKAGLPPGAWRDPRTTVRAFRTKRFGGPAVVSGWRPRSEEQAPDQDEADDHGDHEDHQLDG